MTPIDIQVSRSKVSVKRSSLFFICWEGGISVLQTAIFIIIPRVNLQQSGWSNGRVKILNVTQHVTRHVSTASVDNVSSG